MPACQQLLAMAHPAEATAHQATAHQATAHQVLARVDPMAQVARVDPMVQVDRHLVVQAMATRSRGFKKLLTISPFRSSCCHVVHAAS